MLVADEMKQNQILTTEQNNKTEIRNRTQIRDWKSKENRSVARKERKNQSN